MAGKSGSLGVARTPILSFFLHKTSFSTGPYNEDMRILMFTGKGGVGKTSLAAATGIKLAALNYRTLVMSIDPAHSLGDTRFWRLPLPAFHAGDSDSAEGLARTALASLA
jgi:hypothetical protein